MHLHYRQQSIAMEEEAVIQNDQYWHFTCGLKSGLYRNDIQTNSEVKQYLKLHGLTINDPMNQHRTLTHARTGM